MAFTLLRFCPVFGGPLRTAIGFVGAVLAGRWLVGPAWVFGPAEGLQWVRGGGHGGPNEDVAGIKIGATIGAGTGLGSRPQVGALGVDSDKGRSSARGHSLQLLPTLPYSCPGKSGVSSSFAVVHTAK